MSLRSLQPDVPEKVPPSQALGASSLRAPLLDTFQIGPKSPTVNLHSVMGLILWFPSQGTFVARCSQRSVSYTHLTLPTTPYV